CECGFRHEPFRDFSPRRARLFLTSFSHGGLRALTQFSATADRMPEALPTSHSKTDLEMSTISTGRSTHAIAQRHRMCAIMSSQARNRGSPDISKFAQRLDEVAKANLKSPTGRLIRRHIDHSEAFLLRGVHQPIVRRDQLDRRRLVFGCHKGG